MSFQFDGPNKRIYVQSPTLTFNAVDLYSDWKRWFKDDVANARFLSAMRSIGGDALSQTKFIAPYIELLNDWKIKPYDGDYSLAVQGNLFATGGTTPFIGADSGTVLISMETTGNALALATNTETLEDTNAPLWTSSVGITDAYQNADLINIRWGAATDSSTIVKYNVYIGDSENSLFNFKLGSFENNMVNISTEYDGVTDLKEQSYYIAVRAVDKYGNETTNTNYAIVNYVGVSISDTDVNIISVNGTSVNSIDDFKATETVVDLSETNAKINNVQNTVDLLNNYDDSILINLISSLETLKIDERNKLMSLINYDDLDLRNLINSLETLTQIEHNKLMSLANYDDRIINNKLDEKPSLLDIENSTILAKKTDIDVVETIVNSLPVLSEIKSEMINVQYGKLEITNNQLTIWDKEGNILSVFDLYDNQGNPTMNAVYRREIV